MHWFHFVPEEGRDIYIWHSLVISDWFHFVPEDGCDIYIWHSLVISALVSFCAGGGM